MRDRGGVENVGGDGSEMGLVMKGKKKFTTGIGAHLTPDYRDKQENSNNCVYCAATDHKPQS